MNTFIYVIGLSIGMTCCLLTVLYVTDELGMIEILEEISLQQPDQLKENLLGSGIAER